MRVVLDTVILVRSLLNPLSRPGKLIFEHGNAYELIVSPDITAEYLDVLRRPNISRKFQSEHGASVFSILGVISQATVVYPTSLPDICRDPNDAKFLAAASISGANYLVSEDADLLVLQSFDGVQICDAATMLKILAPPEAR